MNRRQLLTLSVPGQTAAAARTSTGLAPYTGTWTAAEVKHLLRRTMFGATKSDVDYFTGLGMTNTITELLTVPAPPASPLYTSSSQYADPNVPFGTTWVTAPYDPQANGFRIRSFRAWWIGLMLNQGRSIMEKMVLFWHNHFATETGMVGDARFCYNHNALLRQYALGNFKDFTKAVTTDVAMLKYLNGYLNTATAADENYARELQELFTVGKDANGVPYYTEPDVQAAAKVLTGYRINSSNGTWYFSPVLHDTTNKTFSPFYNNTVITGQTGSAGQNELNDLINMIFAADQVAVFICRKLYRYFIYYTIDAVAETDVIQPLATILRTNNYNIAPALEILLSSEHFYDMANRGALIKNPVDFNVGFCRDFGVQFPASSSLEDQYSLWNKIYQTSATMGQAIGDPPNVAGWPAYYQEPQYHELWINTTTLPYRNQMSDRMCTNGYTAGSSQIIFDVVAFTGTLTSPSDPDLLIQEVIDRYYAQDVSANVKGFLKGYLLSGQTANIYWTNAWLDYVNNPGNTSYYNIVQTRLQGMYQYLMDLSEYQLS